MAFRYLLARQPHVAKPARHDAHNAIRVIVQTQRPAENVRVGSEFLPPQSVADHDLQIEAGRGIVRIECATQLRVDTEDREVIRRATPEGDALGLCTSGEVHGREAVNRHELEDAGVLQVSPLRDGDADVLRADAGKVVLDAHQFGGVRVRQRVQQRGVDHAVDRGNGADAERHGGNHRERESRRSQQRANGVAQVVHVRSSALALKKGVDQGFAGRADVSLEQRLRGLGVVAFDGVEDGPVFGS